jgi:hypothetical protein
MALPALLRSNLVPVEPLPEPPSESGPRAGTAALTFGMEQQLHPRWCWAAVAVSVARFYDAGTSWTQCRLADAELGRSDCCGAGGGGPCNVSGFLHTSLGRLGHLDHWTGAATGFSALRVEVDDGNPLCARIAWDGGGAHFVAIFGYTEGGAPPAAVLVSVADPWYGNSDVPYSVFRERYRGSGTWTHSYICQRE